ncbi:HlyD family type I secretion periplasmic adaptor subunit [Paracoccus sp. FO-3]|uniref:HlyD family type I secretion periplasmic adaptor subunit n=1 Tax=Paracoccus sp. FO-3 TaxID=1335059 RepID=UPI00112E9068|nr:HlyD family type I secretion periplasmic adaptor subunit [Paracoccus sp. FO-3]
MGKDRTNAASPADDGRFRLRARVAAGFLLGAVLVLGIGGWAATAQLTGAVIAQGEVAVDQNLKLIQHRDGGIVGSIEIREGDRVTAGQVLFRLDDAQTWAELSIVRSQLIELAARRARLVAERDDQPSIAFPPELTEAGAETASLLAGETRLFEGNRLNRESRKQQLELGIVQIGEEIAGLEAQRAAKLEEIELVEAEHLRISALTEARLIEVSRVFATGRERSRLLGERGEIDAAIARAKTRTNEVRLQIIAIDETARTEAQRELSLVETRISELQDRRAAIEDRLTRTDIRAPIAGIVNEMKIHTIGGVISPAEVLATIVPEDARLKIGVKFAPASIDQIAVGQTARLRFSAFNQRTTPELEGVMTYVAAATSRVGATGDSFYAGDIEVGPEELAKLAGLQLVPGMPVEVFVTTEERTAFSYLAKPLTDQFNRAFRER